MSMAGFGNFLQKLPRLPALLGRTWAGCVGLLVGAVLAAFPLVALYAYSVHGAPGITAAVVAAAICTLAATLALVSTALLRGPQAALYAVLFGMVFRLGLPLAAGIFLSNRGGPLAEAGVFGFIVVFYLLTLAVETPLSLLLLGSERRTTKSG